MTLPCSEPVPLQQLQRAVLAMLGNGGLPNFPILLRGLKDALNGNCTTLLGDHTPTVESVVAIPLECGDIGTFIVLPSFARKPRH